MTGIRELFRLSLSMLGVGCIGFGGGSALIPLLEKVLAGVRHPDESEAFDRDVVAACMTPGALPVEIAGGAGLRRAGRLGMVVSASAMALPGAVGAVVLSAFLATMRGDAKSVFSVCAIVVGVYVTYLIASYIFKVIARGGSVRRRLAIVAVIAGVSVLSLGFRCSSALILSSVIFPLAGYTLIVERPRFTVTFPIVIRDFIALGVYVLVFALPAILLVSGDASLALLKFSARGAFSALISFGGGDAYLTVADGLFVDSGLLASAIYYGEIVAVVNILPGSILCKTLTVIGYHIGMAAGGQPLALAFAACGFGVSVAFSCLSFSFALRLYDSFRMTTLFRFLEQWVRPIVCGLLVKVLFTLFKSWHWPF